VLDAFLGSGTTVIAAERTGRRCHGMELDPAYVDIRVCRWRKLTGGSTRHAASAAGRDPFRETSVWQSARPAVRSKEFQDAAG
jgi:hypothetical protein